MDGVKRKPAVADIVSSKRIEVKVYVEVVGT
jgi:hypothetical protein